MREPTFKEILEKHRLWLEGAEGGERACLRNKTIKGLPNLRGICLRKADLHAARFLNCNLTAADFSEADCTAAHFDKSNMEGCNFTGADLSKATLNKANLSSADFSNAHIAGADFSGTDLRGARFRDADDGFVVTHFDGADMRVANLCYSNLHCGIFKNAQLDGVDASGAKMEFASFVNTSLKNACFYGADLNLAYFERADLSGTVFAAADMSGANIILDQKET